LRGAARFETGLFLIKARMEEVRGLVFTGETSGQLSLTGECCGYSGATS
jgi:hypothetical protein